MAKRSNERKIVINNVQYSSLESAAKTFGKSRNTIDYRLSKGWTPEQAVGLESHLILRPRLLVFLSMLKDVILRTSKKQQNIIIVLTLMLSKCLKKGDLLSKRWDL